MTDSAGPKSKAATRRKRDMVLIHGIDREREQVHVLRAREDRVEAGVMKAIKEGEPLDGGEIVKITPRPEFPLLCDVETQVAAGVVNSTGSSDAAERSTSAGAGRPAQVASQAYRDNWDSIWAKKRGKKALPN